MVVYYPLGFSYHYCHRCNCTSHCKETFVEEEGYEGQGKEVRIVEEKFVC